MAQPLRFDRFELLETERQLLLDGVQVPLGSRAFDLLCTLVRHRDRVLGKSELLDRVWPGLVVEENNLSVQVSTLRKLLGPSAIATVPTIGYRFTRPVTVADAPWTGDGLGEPTEPIDRVLQQAHQRDRVLAVLQPRCAPDVWAGSLLPVACAHLTAWQGQLHQVDATGLAAVFPGVRQAQRWTSALRAAVARSGTSEAELVVGVARWTDGAAASALGAAQGLAERAAPGQTLLTPDAAAHLIHKLDGELASHDGQDGVSLRPAAWPVPPPTPPTTAPTLGVVARLHPTLAVIPLRPYGQEPPHLHIGDVLADQLIAALSRSSAMNVISRLSCAAFRDIDAESALIGHQLGAQYLVSGRYLLGSGRLQVHAELARASDGVVLWTQQFSDGELSVLQQDSTLVQTLVQGITSTVLSHELRALRSQPLPTLASHTLLLAAIGLLYRLSPTDFDLAHQALLALRERAPRHPEPVAWLARWHLFRVVQGWTANRSGDGQQALQYAQQALDLDPDSPLALTMLGNVHTSHLRDLDRAASLYDQALARNPNESLAWLQKGNTCSFRGDGAAALVHAEKAVALSPLDPARHYYQSILASAALSAHDYPRAIAAAQESLRQNHEHVSTHRVLAIAMSLSGRIDEARASVREVLRLEPGLTVADFVARSPGARSGLAQTFGRALLNAGLPAGAINAE